MPVPYVDAEGGRDDRRIGTYLIRDTIQEYCTYIGMNTRSQARYTQNRYRRESRIRVMIQLRISPLHPPDPETIIQRYTPTLPSPHLPSPYLQHYHLQIPLRPEDLQPPRTTPDPPLVVEHLPVRLLFTSLVSPLSSSIPGTATQSNLPDYYHSTPASRSS